MNVTPAPSAQAFPTRLLAAGCALLAAAALCAGVRGFVGRVVRRDLDGFNANAFPTPPRAAFLATDLQVDKLKGELLLRQAFRDPAILPVFGSSELTQPQANRADQIFSTHPSYFGAFLLGNPGETCLMIASKLAALGPEARGKKAVVFLSPSWFLAPELDHRGFGVNFSPLHGGAFAFGRAFSPELRRGLARRLLDYPETVGQDALLEGALRAFTDGGAWRQAVRAGSAPLAFVQNEIQRTLDAARVGLWAWRHGWPGGSAEIPENSGSAVSKLRVGFNWPVCLERAEDELSRLPAQTSYSVGPRTGFDDARLRQFRDPAHPDQTPDELFTRACIKAKEWTDLALLLQTAREQGLRLLVVCQPLNANFCRLQGLTERSSALFYDRLRQATAPFPAAELRTFPDAEGDPHFYQDSVHPSAKAWVAYDEALDGFYHGAEGGNVL